jgi:hypothetical protein
MMAYSVRASAPWVQCQGASSVFLDSDPDRLGQPGSGVRTPDSARKAASHKSRFRLAFWSHVTAPQA